MFYLYFYSIINDRIAALSNTKKFTTFTSGLCNGVHKSTIQYRLCNSIYGFGKVVYSTFNPFNSRNFSSTYHSSTQLQLCTHLLNCKNKKSISIHNINYNLENRRFYSMTSDEVLTIQIKNTNSKNNTLNFSLLESDSKREILGFTKKNIKNIYFDFYNMDFDTFKSELLDFIKPNIRYAFLIKIKREDGGIGMGNKHIPFLSNEESFSENFNQLYNDVVEIINIFISEYNDCEVLYIMLMFIQLESFPDLKLQNIKKLKLNKEFDKLSLTKRNFNSLILPLTEKTFYYGKKLERKIENGKLISVIIDDINFIDLVGKTLSGKSFIIKDTLQHENINFYLYRNIKGQNYIIITNVDEERSTKEVFTLSGLKILEAYDRIDENNPNIFKRKIGNTSITIDSSLSKSGLSKSEKEIISQSQNTSSVLKYEVEHQFSTIKSRDSHFNKDKNDISHVGNDQNVDSSTYEEKNKNNKHIMSMRDRTKKKEMKIERKFLDIHSVSNSNIGVLDIETYFSSEDNKSFVYALGYKIFKGPEQIFYLSKDQSSTNLILECINSMLIEKYHGFIFYVHNLGGFDGIFLLNALNTYNVYNNDYYKIDTIFRDNRIIRLTISIKLNNKSRMRKITFVDSYNLLQSSIKKLCLDFNCEVMKGIFPYDFVSKDTLNYIGNTPGIEYYPKDEITQEEYKLEVRDD